MATPSSLLARPHVLRALVAVGIAALVFAVVAAVFALHYANAGGTKAGSSATAGPASAVAPTPGYAAVRRRASTFQLSALGATGTVGTATVKGPMVVNFWSSTCSPCRQEMPVLAAAAATLRGKVAIVGVDTDDTATRALAFARSHGAHYPIGSDPNGIVGNHYDLAGLPTSYFLSRDHRRVVGIYFGAMTKSELASALRRAYGITLAPATT
jgi:cytochrome c biogenesis protein CcmG, thiol:disulfide interchange protein DsbE